MDEHPEMPYYSLDDENLYYDSTGLALHLDTLGHTAQALLPEFGVERFLCRLIDEAWRNHLAAMEQLLTRQPFLPGQRFTLADAST